MKLIIGNKNYSSWSLRPWLLLRHFEIEFEEIRIPLFTEGFEATLARFTDANKVPVLHDGDINIWDSLAICEYISEQYLDGKGWPSDSTARAMARSASAEMHSSFFEIREHMPMNCRAKRRIDFTPELHAEINRVQQLWMQLRTRYADQGPWLLGDFSIADCIYAPMALRFNSYQPELNSTSREYIATILSHPAMKLWIQQAADEKEIIEFAEVGEMVD